MTRLLQQVCHDHLFIRRRFAEPVARTPEYVLLDLLSNAVVLFDDRLQVVFANRASARLLKEHGALRLVGSRLRAQCPVEQRRLDEAFILSSGSKSSVALCLRGAPGKSPISIVLVSVHSADADDPDRPTDCNITSMMFLTDPARSPDVLPQRLAEAYGFTLAESRVALAAGRGETISEIAQSLQVSINTVKTHLRRVYAKADIHRQAELVRLIGALESCQEPRSTQQTVTGEQGSILRAPAIAL